MTGVLGVLLRAKEEGRMGNVESLPKNLREEADFWISDALWKDVLRRAGEHGNRINTGRTSTVAPNLLWSRSDRLIGTFRTIGWALSQAQSDDGGVSVSRECLERYFRGKSI